MSLITVKVVQPASFSLITLVPNECARHNSSQCACHSPYSTNQSRSHGSAQLAQARSATLGSAIVILQSSAHNI